MKLSNLSSSFPKCFHASVKHKFQKCWQISNLGKDFELYNKYTTFSQAKLDLSYPLQFLVGPRLYWNALSIRHSIWVPHGEAIQKGSSIWLIIWTLAAGLVQNELQHQNNVQDDKKRETKAHDYDENSIHSHSHVVLKYALKQSLKSWVHLLRKPRD